MGEFYTSNAITSRHQVLSEPVDSKMYVTQKLSCMDRSPLTSYDLEGRSRSPKPEKPSIPVVVQRRTLLLVSSILRQGMSSLQRGPTFHNLAAYQHGVYASCASKVSIHCSALLLRTSDPKRHKSQGAKKLQRSSSLRLPSNGSTPQETRPRRLAVRPEPECKSLPHLNTSSEVHQISVGHKVPSRRVAVAAGLVRFSDARVLGMIKNHALQKGDVLAVARVAGIMAVKNTSIVVPLAHNNVAVEGCSIDLSLIEPDDEDAAIVSQALEQQIGSCGGLKIQVICESTGKTGVEMEAVCGVVGAALTVVDMCKSVDKDITITDVKTIGKKGGKSGDWGTFAEE